MPVYKLKEMSYDELMKWFSYFKRRPIGWREDYRASLIMQSFGAKIKSDELFPSLAAIKLNEESKKTQISTLKGSKLFMNMLGAKGGDSLDILKDL